MTKWFRNESFNAAAEEEEQQQQTMETSGGLVRNQQLRTRFETKGYHSSAIKALAISNPVQSATKPNDKNQLGTDALITAPLNSVKIT